jgi:hypothetical protein
MTRDEAISLQKAALWEEAKGKLKAVVATGGQCSPVKSHHGERWTALEKAVDAFIVDVEENGWHE